MQRILLLSWCSSKREIRMCSWDSCSNFCCRCFCIQRYLGCWETMRSVRAKDRVQSVSGLILALSSKKEIVSPRKWAFAMKALSGMISLRIIFKPRENAGGVETSIQISRAVKSNGCIIYLHGGAYTAEHPNSYKTFTGTPDVQWEWYQSITRWDTTLRSSWRVVCARFRQTLGILRLRLQFHDSRWRP